MREDWEYKELGEVCDIYQPKTISNEMLVKGGKYPVYGANGTIGFYNRYNHTDSEILLTCRGATCGTINVSQPYSWINGNAMVIHRKSDYLDFKYLYFLMTSLDYSLIINGAAQPQITRARLAPIQVAIPPKPTQLSIVSEFDKLNELIQIKKEQLKDYDALAQSIFYEMFGDPVENEKGWKVKKLGELCSKIGSGATPRGGNESYKDEGISLIRSLNVYNNEFRRKDLAYIDDEQAAALSNVTILEDDVLLNITGASVARCCIVPSDLLPARVNQHVCIIRPLDNVLVPIFLNKVLTNISYQIRLLALARSKGATREALPKSVVDSLLIPLPPLPLQHSFAQKIEQIEQQKAAIQKTITDLETLLAARIQYWFD